MRALFAIVGGVFLLAALFAGSVAWMAIELLWRESPLPNSYASGALHDSCISILIFGVTFTPRGLLFWFGGSALFFLLVAGGCLLRSLDRTGGRIAR